MGMTPEKVLHVMNGAEGGAARSTIQLMGKLREMGIESCAVCHGPGRKSSQEEVLEATKGETAFFPLYWWNRKNRADVWKRPLLEMRQIFRTGHGMGSALKTAQWISQFNADLVHTNTVLTCEGAFAARMLKIPHVWHVRELLLPKEHFQLPLQGKELIRFFRDYASIVVANSEVTAKTIGQPPDITSDLLRIVHNGIDVDLFAPKNGIVKKPLVVGMVASLTSVWKRHDLFLKAASLVKNQDAVSFRIYGLDPSQNGSVSGGRYMDSIHQLITNLGMKDRIKFTGFISNPVDIMKETDIVVHPCERESFGRIVIEAMASECPVVGPRSGGVGELVEDGKTGFSVEPNNPGALAVAIDKLVDDPAMRKKMGRAGRKEVADKYSLDVHAEKMLKVYRSAMKRPLRWRKERVELL
jgi:glycosyltransferase involved in cell wall biosynthesis